MPRLDWLQSLQKGSTAFPISLSCSDFKGPAHPKSLAELPYNLKATLVRQRNLITQCYYSTRDVREIIYSPKTAAVCCIHLYIVQWHISVQAKKRHAHSTTDHSLAKLERVLADMKTACESCSEGGVGQNIVLLRFLPFIITYSLLCAIQLQKIP